MLEGARERAAELGHRERQLQGAERRMDRPAARERRHRPLPLGLHADGRPGRGARRDPARARPRRAAGGRRVGFDRAQPVGLAARAGAGRARARPGGWDADAAGRAAGERAAGAAEWAAAQQPGPFALGDAGRFAELLADAGFTEVSVEELELVAPAHGLRGVLGHDARHLAAVPRRRDVASRAADRSDPRTACGGAWSRTPGADGTLRDPGPYVGGEGERLSRPLA